MKICFLSLLFLCLVIPAGWAKCSRWNTENLLYASQKAFESALSSEYPQQRIDFVRDGLKWANGCVESYPKEFGCHYYRALLQGLQIEQQGLGFQKKLGKMVQDLNLVAENSPQLDDAGAYRTLGYIYLKAPEFSLKKKGVTRDLDKSYSYAEQAIKIAPFSLDNRLLWALVLLEQEKFEEAKIEFNHLKEDFQKKKSLNRQETKDLKIINNSLEKINRKNHSKY